MYILKLDSHEKLVISFDNSKFAKANALPSIWFSRHRKKHYNNIIFQADKEFPIANISNTSKGTEIRKYHLSNWFGNTSTRKRSTSIERMK